MIQTRVRNIAGIGIVAAATCLAWSATTAGGSVAAAPRKAKAPLSLNLRATAGRWTQTTRPSGPIEGAPIRNLGVVVPGCIYRSAQPSEEGLAWMQSQGFRSIVSLRKERDLGAERIGKYGLKYLYIPITDWTAPSMKQGEQFLKFASNPENWPLLVHCEAGMGRAGCMAALVRYSMGGWKMEQALQEARRYRTFSWPIYGEQLQFLRQWARTHPRGGLRPSGTAAQAP